MILLTIIMNMQNKLNTIHFSLHPMTDLQSVPKQRSQNPNHMDFVKFTKRLNALKSSKSRTREDLNSRQ